MLKKKLGKRNIEIESFFEEILVCNDKENRPFLEVFVHEPENIIQKDLGALLGIFEINDDSEDSSYIVNYLISVIKKEYFSRPKRGTVESFEAALHKANLALAKLAEYGNISWIGKINALCVVAEKQNLHLTQTGNTLALLLRKGYLTNISEDLSPDTLEPNPLKTFVNISSGKLENRDKLIILTDNILNILDLEEIKNNALNFSEKDFVQFLRTVLVNKLEKAAALVMDVKEKEEILLPVAKKAEKLNAFSNSAFSKPSLKKEMETEAGAQEMTDQFLPPEEAPKAGHIYIKESPEPKKFKKNFSFSFFKKRTSPDQPDSALQTQTQKVKEKIQLLWESLKVYPFKEKIIRVLKFFGRILWLIFSFLKDCVIWTINNSIIGQNYPADIAESLSSQNTFDYNQFYSLDLTKFYTVDVTNYTSWANVDASKKQHSANSNPLFVSASDFHLLSGSPAIDSGTDVGLTSDYAGNPIYGLPDIGAYEYQPTETMGEDRIPTDVAVRTYGDEKYRDKATTSQAEDDQADLSVAIPDSNTTEWLDIQINTWLNTDTYNKNWTEATDSEITNTIHTIGDLEAGKNYNITVTDATNDDLEGESCSVVGSDFVCLSNDNGKIVFTYKGTYSNHTFDVTEGDNVGPTTTASPDGGTYTTAQTVTLTCNDDDGVGCDKTYYTIDGTEPTISSTEYTVPINISATTTLKFFATDLNGESEAVKTKIYTIDTTEEQPENSKIESWKASEYQNPNASCQQRLKLEIKGKHFDKNAEVRIGNKEASSVNRKSSKEITAKFCLEKPLNVKTDLKRTISVTNPDADRKKADKKINLGNLTPQITSDSLNTQTVEGVKNIQRALVKLGLLDQRYITGFYGPITTEAVRKFQEQNGILQTGTIDSITLEKMEKTSG